jgi:striatin 1/3/4
MDGVRGLHFIPNSGALVSASEDCTIKVWDMQGIHDNDLEPYVTLRGHVGQIMSLTGIEANAQSSPLNDMVFSGGVNGQI